MNKKKRRGFTLVEMVLVITILGIISSLGFSKFGVIQDNVKKKSDYIAAANLASASSLAIENGDIEPENGQIDITKLMTKKYINSIPKPQSKPKDDFLINVGSDGHITVKISSEANHIYPQPDN